MQHLLSSSGLRDDVDEELGVLQLRERFFSLDREDFPDINALDQMPPENKITKRRSLVAVRATKQDSGIKFRSVASTLDSVRAQQQPDEPIIVDATPLSQEQVLDRYMLGKDRAYLDSLRLDMIDDGNFNTEHKTLWQSMPASFFEMTVNPRSVADGPGEPGEDDDSAGSYEFLRNPSGYELNPEQR